MSAVRTIAGGKVKDQDGRKRYEKPEVEDLGDLTALTKGIAVTPDGDGVASA